MRTSAFHSELKKIKHHLQWKDALQQNTQNPILTLKQKSETFFGPKPKKEWIIKQNFNHWTYLTVNVFAFILAKSKISVIAI